MELLGEMSMPIHIVETPDGCASNGTDDGVHAHKGSCVIALVSGAPQRSGVPLEERTRGGVFAVI